MEKIKTYQLFQNGAEGVVDTSIDNILETLRSELENSELEDDDDEIEYSIVIEKKYTQKELDDMPEWDGDF